MAVKAPWKWKLVTDARRVWMQSWTVRLSLVAALFSSLQAGVEYYLTGKKAWPAIMTALMSFAAAMARIIAQEALSGASKPKGKAKATIAGASSA